MTQRDYGADEAALRTAIDRLPDDLFGAYRGAWQDSITLALLDAIYFLHPTYQPHHPERGITSRVFAFAQRYPQTEDSLESLAQLDEAAVRQIMGYGKTGATLRSEAVLEAARGMLALDPPIIAAGNFSAARLSDVREVFAGVPGLGRVAFTNFATNLGVPGANVDPKLRKFVARHAYGDPTRRLRWEHVAELVTNAYQRDHRGAETVSHFEHALQLAERRCHDP